jgi:hypothetical protein
MNGAVPSKSRAVFDSRHFLLKGAVEQKSCYPGVNAQLIGELKSNLWVDAG